MLDGERWDAKEGKDLSLAYLAGTRHTTNSSICGQWIE